MRAVAPVCAVFVAVAVTGCTGGSSTPSTAPASAVTTPSSPTASASASGTTTPTVAPTPTTAPSSSPTPVLVGGSPAECTTSSLHLTVGHPGAAAGTTFQVLVVKNVGAAPCALAGYPGASFIGSAGNQLGPSARRDRSNKPRRIRLAPGDEANARLGAPDPAMFSDSDCQPQHATAVRVYPPDQTAPLQAAVDQKVCTTKAGRSFVSAFEAGAPSG